MRSFIKGLTIQKHVRILIFMEEEKSGFVKLFGGYHAIRVIDFLLTFREFEYPFNRNIRKCGSCLEYNPHVFSQIGGVRDSKTNPKDRLCNTIQIECRQFSCKGTHQIGQQFDNGTYRSTYYGRQNYHSIYCINGSSHKLGQKYLELGVIT